MSGPGEITRLLAEWSDRNDAALDHLVAIMYDELQRLASNYMRGERPGHLLQTTALVHEAYLRLIDREHVSCQTRTQFFAVAARSDASRPIRLSRKWPASHPNSVDRLTYGKSGLRWNF
jgi:ECF sigma factor